MAKASPKGSINEKEVGDIMSQLDAMLKAGKNPVDLLVQRKKVNAFRKPNKKKKK